MTFPGTGLGLPGAAYGLKPVCSSCWLNYGAVLNAGQLLHTCL